MPVLWGAMPCTLRWAEHPGQPYNWNWRPYEANTSQNSYVYHITQKKYYSRTGSMYFHYTGPSVNKNAI